MDKVLKYGVNNHFEYSEHPPIARCGDERTINIFASIPNVK